MENTFTSYKVEEYQSSFSGGFYRPAKRKPHVPGTRHVAASVRDLELGPRASAAAPPLPGTGRRPRACRPPGWVWDPRAARHFCWGHYFDCFWGLSKSENAVVSL